MSFDMGASQDDKQAESSSKIDFHHPYTPYHVQEQFMRAVYDVLEKGHVGILESPTGTGKSLSLICGSLTWLRHHKSLEFDASLSKAGAKFEGEPDWIIEQLLKRQKDELVRKWRERETRLEKARQAEQDLEQRATKRRRVDKLAHDDNGFDEREWLLDDDGLDADVDDLTGLSKATKAMLEKVGLIAKPEDIRDENVDDDQVKIYYTSRTHSQITQFVSELRRPKFPSSLPKSIRESLADNQETETVKEVPLSSRQKLCINPKVARLGSVQAINDRCAELQKPKASDRCPFMLNAENLAETHQFRDRALATVPDIEDLYVLGKSLQVCPYYASRTAVANAEIVTLPYQLLLQKTARDALGIKLEGNVVIIDEAHNIMDAIAGAYAAEIKLSELRRAREMMAVYAKRFGKKLKGENRVMVGQLGRVVQGLSDWMEGALGLKEGEGIVDSNELLKHRGIDQINLFKLIEYIQESKLAFKIESYAAHAEAQQQDEQAGPASSASKSQGQRRHASQPQSPVLHSLTSFLVSLTNLSTEGRIFYHRMPSTSGTPDIRLSYLLLSPTHAFSPIVEAARAVILAGGTMAPMSDFVTHLFPQVDPTRITTLSCGHVIPKDNLCVWTLASSSPIPAGVAADDKDAFDFSFARRSDRAMIRRLGTALLNVCNVVPDGIVVFFPSYGYLDEVVTSWQSMATDGSTVSASSSASQQQSIYARLNIRKSIFRDARDADGEAVLRDYSAAVLGTVSEGGDALDSGGGAASSSKKNPAPTRGKGALLLSVVGGRMSEGINFSDALGRCVVVVGLPYPNAHSPEWKARAEYVEQSTFERLTNPAKNSNKDASRLDTDPGAPPSSASSETQPHTTAGIAPAQAREASKQAAREFYENACMRAVNQSVGRAVRHKDDYAAIVLVDRRFATPRIRGKLPGWIREGMVAGSETKGVPGLMGSLGAFFRGKRDVAVKLPTR